MKFTRFFGAGTVSAYPAFLALWSIGICLSAADSVPLKTGPHRDVTIKPVGEGVSEIAVSGGSPHFWTAPVPLEFDPDKHTVVAFEYFSPSGVESISVRYRQSDGSMTLGGSGTLPLAETWQPFSIDFSKGEPAPPKGDAAMRFHFAMNYNPNASLRIRNFEVRAPNADEIAAAADKEARMARRQADADAYLAYLRTEHPNAITGVSVGSDTIVIKGRASVAGVLREVLPHITSHGKSGAGTPAEVAPEDFEISLPRFTGEGKKDRALSRWRLEEKSGRILSHARWPYQVEAGITTDLPKLSAPHQKGLGGIPAIVNGDHEIFELGIRHATVNFIVSSLISASPRPGFEPFQHEGRQWFFNAGYLRQTETTVQQLCAKDIIVSCILLVGNGAGHPMTHPEAERRGIYSIPNLAQAEGATHYRAAIHLLGDRFTRPATRVSNWIIHNEIDQAGVWTNMGDQPLARYLETYMRSARLVHHTMRLRDPHARVFVSLTHHWNKQSSGMGTYRVRDMVDLFAEMSRAEGDFEWGLAYHPYPRDLRNPDTWNDTEVTADFDTPYITPKNLEVLPAYLAQEPFLFEGKKQRAILFSEQGFNTPTLSEEDQRRQVAGLIYTFRKLKALPTVEAYHLHRYQDMPDREGGLRLGIIDEHGNRKLGWDAYTAIGTEGELPFAAMADEVMMARKGP